MKRSFHVKKNPKTGLSPRSRSNTPTGVVRSRPILYTRCKIMDLKSVFLDPSNTLRSGWRFAVFCCVHSCSPSFQWGSRPRSWSPPVLYPSNQAFGSPVSADVTACFADPGPFCGLADAENCLKAFRFKALGAWFTEILV